MFLKNTAVEVPPEPFTSRLLHETTKAFNRSAPSADLPFSICLQSPPRRIMQQQRHLMRRHSKCGDAMRWDERGVVHMSHDQAGTSLADELEEHVLISANPA